MIDCSRNAVFNINGVKKWIDITSSLGYNCLMLYTEDTFTVENNPYFGYLRGKYSVEEIKEIDAYAAKKGIELMPCIQTLAHLNAIFRWPKYSQICDFNDILLSGDEKTYELIDDIFKSISAMFTSKTVNIGMDEAHMLGLGKFLDKNGYQNRSDILLVHLKKVSEIAEKYGLKLLMWGDMFAFLKNKGYSLDDVRSKIPHNVELIYWDYYSNSPKTYENNIANFNSIKENTWFAGGLITWMGFVPHNDFSIKTAKVALESCQKMGVQDVFLTIWGDDGAECSKFSVLPSLFYASEIAKGNSNLRNIKKKFKEWCGIPFDSFMLTDLPETPQDIKGRTANSSKHMFYNDCLLGIYDTTVKESGHDSFKKCARRLGRLKKNKQYGYIFETLQALCEVLAVKYDFGVRVRTAYQSNNLNELAAIEKECGVLIKKTERFYDAFERQWMIENKPHGFDIQDLRIGGVIMRIKHLRKKLKAYLKGELRHIAELEENLLDAFGNGEDYRPDDGFCKQWKDSATVNVIYHNTL